MLCLIIRTWWKLGAINNLFLCGFKTCDRAFLDLEINVITQVVKHMGYDDCIIERRIANPERYLIQSMEERLENIIRLLFYRQFV